MATPTFVHDLTSITDGETTTGWVAVGGAMLTLDPDTFIQGSNSIGIPGTASTVVGGVFNIGSTVDLSGKHLFIWVVVNVPGKIASFSEGGIRVRVAGSTASNFGEWFVGGREMPWCAEGKWRLIVVDTSRAFDATGGTPPALTAIQHVGVTGLTTAALMQGFVFNIDIMRYGTKIAVAGGSDADPVTLQNIYDEDFLVDPVTNCFGIVTKNRAGTFEVNGELRIGRESGAGDTVFSTRNEVVIFQDQPCAEDYLKIKVQQGTGTTKFKAGSAIGLGAARVGLNGSIFDRVSGFHGREYSLDFAASVNLIEFFGSTVLRAKRGATFPDATGHEIVSSSFVASGQVAVRKAQTRKSVFSGHGFADTGATTLSVTANPVDSGSITINVDATARTYTRSTGSFVTDGFVAGQVVTMSGFTNANNNGKKTIQSVTATVIKVLPSLALVTETGGGDERVRIEFGYTRAAGSFVTDGITAGMAVTASGFSTSGNNGAHIVTSVTATLVTVKHLTGLAAETGGGDEKLRQSGATGDGALLWNDTIDIASSSFLGNVNAKVTAAAVEHPGSAGSPYTYDALTFSGNDFDVNNSSGSAITIQKTNGADPATSKGSAVTFTGSFTYTITGLVSGSEVRVYNDATGVELDGIESSGASFVYTHSGAAITIRVIVQHLSYEWLLFTDTIASANKSNKVIQRTDRNYANP